MKLFFIFFDILFFEVIILHYNIIVLSNKIQTCEHFHVISSKIKLIDDCNLLLNNENISFDYLIITDLSLVEGYKEIGILTENKIPVTNYEHQTSIENIYYTQESRVFNIINEL